MAYLITYDLRKPGRDYNALYEAVKKYGQWCHPLNNVWFVVTSQDIETVRDYLTSYIDSTDSLIVVKVLKEAAWTNLDPKVTNWLQTNL